MNRKLLPIVLIVLIDMIGFGIIIPILQLFAEERFGASNFAATALLAAFAAAQFVAAPVLGRLSDAFGRRPVLILSQIGTLAGFVVLGTANSLFLLFLGRIIDGISGGNITTAEAYVNDVTTEEDRAKGFGMVKAAYGAGFILGPVLGGLIAKLAASIPALAAYSQSAPFFVAAIISLGSILATTLWLPESLPAGVRSPLGQRKVRASGGLREVLSVGAVQRLLTYALLTFAAFAIFQASFALVVARNVLPGRSLEDTQLTMALLLAWAGVLIVVAQGGLVGPLVERFGERRLVVASALLRIPAFVGLALAQNPIVMALWFIPMAIGNGIGQPTQQSLISRYASDSVRGQVLGVLTSTNSLALILGPLLAGVLLDVTTSAPNLAAAALTGVAFLISLPILRLAVPSQDQLAGPSPVVVATGD